MAESSPNNPDLKPQIILVGIGGASCSGKTTLAKHLRSILKDSFIIHQDDFAPPEEQVPFHPKLGIQDWDDPDGAIVWPKMIEFMRRVKEEGRIPDDHRSHDHLNPQSEVPVPKEVLDTWSAKLTEIKESVRINRGIDITWGIVDGFLLYWHPDVFREIDVRIFLREPYATLKARREARFGYHTAVQYSPEGSFWEDPPGYWDDIVWPAYVKAHKGIFENEDYIRGKPIFFDDEKANSGSRKLEEKESNASIALDKEDGHQEVVLQCGGPVPRLQVFQSQELSMKDVVDEACRRLEEYVSRNLGGIDGS